MYKKDPTSISRIFDISQEAKVRKKKKPPKKYV